MPIYCSKYTKRHLPKLTILLRPVPAIKKEQHHDFIDFHTKRAQGVRILTVFLYLNDVEKGKEAFTSHDQMRLFLSIAHDFMFGIFLQ